jgi:hypothetical protein
VQVHLTANTVHGDSVVVKHASSRLAQCARVTSHIQPAIAQYLRKDLAGEPQAISTVVESWPQVILWSGT